MLKLIKFILTIQALVNVATLPSTKTPTTLFDKVMGFIVYTTSSLYVFLGVIHFLKVNEHNIIGLFFIEDSDYLLFKILVTALSNFFELNKGNHGALRVLANALIFTLYENKVAFFNLIFSNVLFTEIYVPGIRIAYNNIFQGKELHFLNLEIDKLKNGLYYLVALYFVSVVIMTQKHKLY